MARITVEDCLENVENRFVLVGLTASRVRQLIRGSQRQIGSNNKDIVEALREIAAGYVRLQEKTVVEDTDSLKVEIPV